MRKLRPKEVKEVAKVTKLVSRGASNETTVLTSLPRLLILS